MKDASDVPVLVTMFNRPDHARRVLEAIGRSKPKRLFIAVEGPRPAVPGEAEGVEACRALAGSIDWPCEVETRFREENLGCREGMIDGVSWFFSRVEAGVVLEDDCVPDDDFFRYAAEVLALFEEDARLMQLSGYGHADHPGGRVHFIPLTSSWGWGTTRAVWEGFLKSREGITADFEANPHLHEAFDFGGAYPYSRMFLSNLEGKVSSWAILFYWHVFRSGGLVAYPAESLIRNIGFDGSGSHRSAKSADEEGAVPAQRSGGTVPGRIECDEGMVERVRAVIGR